MTDETTQADEPVMIEWTAEEREKLRQIIDEPKRRAELFDKAERGLKEATDRLAIQQDALIALAGKIGSGEPGTLDAEEAALVADAVAAALLRFAVEDMTDQILLDRYSGTQRATAVLNRTPLFIGNGGLW